MVADAAIEVWLAAQSGMGPATVIPYVKTVDVRKLTYKIEVLKKGASGSARLRHGGTVETVPNKPTELTHIQVSVQPGDECTVKVDLADGESEIGQFAFDCLQQPR